MMSMFDALTSHGYNDDKMVSSSFSSRRVVVKHFPIRSFGLDKKSTLLVSIIVRELVVPQLLLLPV